MGAHHTLDVIAAGDRIKIGSAEYVIQTVRADNTGIVSITTRRIDPVRQARIDGLREAAEIVKGEHCSLSDCAEDACRKARYIGERIAAKIDSLEAGL